jgi:hypothetical protein
MTGMSRRKRILLLPFISILASVGWVLTYFGGINFHTKRVGFVTVNEKMVRLQKQLENAIVEERQGIILGFLGVCALVPFILYGSFPLWTYVSAGIFSILGYVTMAHGNRQKTIIKEQLCSMNSIALR